MLSSVKKSNFNKFLGSLIKKGNKVAAKKILYVSLKKTSERNKLLVKKSSTPARVLTRIFDKLQTNVEAKTVVRGKGRKARKNIIPFPLKAHRQRFLKIKWLVQSAKEEKKEIRFSEKLITEMSNVLYDRKKSKALLKKKAAKKVVLANRSNSHFRW